MKHFLIFGFLFLLAACAETPAFQLSSASFNDLPGWNNDRQSEALSAFARSCAKLAGKSGKYNWRTPCAALVASMPADDAAARAFFERYFTPYSVNGGDDGLFTGYYEAELHGAPEMTGQYRVPLYTRPDDLISVDLGLFKDELNGKHIVGKVSKTELIPYDDRAAIANSSLNGRARPIVWVDDPVDAFFLEVQGSGQVKLADGSVMRVGYDGANGRAYVAIGKALADMGELQKPVTMQAIRGWLAAHPDRAQEIMDLNPSYVFFRRIEGDGPIGAEGVALTSERSMAVDPSYISLGTPVWLDTSSPEGAPLRRLMIAQDTGGAIKGAVRGDFFWGAGETAEREAGAMQSRGRYFVLLPKSTDDGR
jgi:membrane-bound lytic murein transglycosylase A